MLNMRRIFSKKKHIPFSYNEKNNTTEAFCLVYGKYQCAFM